MYLRLIIHYGGEKIHAAYFRAFQFMCLLLFFTFLMLQEANYGMASPHGYRMALRLMQVAERFNLPVITIVDTVGAWPTFECERDGQSEAIATNLTAMASLKVANPNPNPNPLPNLNPNPNPNLLMPWLLSRSQSSPWW